MSTFGKPNCLKRAKRRRSSFSSEAVIRTYATGRILSVKNIFRPYAINKIADALAQLVEHLCGLQRRQRCSAAFHESLIL